jgi:pyruvate/2-oxoglutarate dehydrogenase complex dihydrolipoamide acyltransferase (E2) component
MATKVLVPRLGEGVDEVTVTKWLKQVGDSVKELEPLLEVNTDKVDTEIPAPASGVILNIEMQEGQVAKVGELLAIIGALGESADSGQLSVDSNKSIANVQHQQLTTNYQSSTANHQPPTTNRETGFISPVVAKIAAEHGVNLSQVQGTGLNGRITKNDVLAFVGNWESGVVAPAAKPSNLQPANVTPTPGDQLIKHTNIKRHGSGHVTRVEASGRERSRFGARWNHTHAHRVFYVRDCGGVESISDSQFVLE